MLDFFKNLVAMRRDRNEAGASAVEYGLLNAGIAVVVAAGVLLLGPKVNDKFNETCKAVNSNAACTSGTGGTGG